MTQAKVDRTISSPLQLMSGPEIEILSDYWGQPTLVVQYTKVKKKEVVIHRLQSSYNNVIAAVQGEDPNNIFPLCITTDSNRSEEREGFPMRTCMEFRSGPTAEKTEELLHVAECWSTWLTREKTKLYKKVELTPAVERSVSYYLKVSDFISFYNKQKKSKNKLTLISPKQSCVPSLESPDFHFPFPENAEWLLEFQQKDLKPEYKPVFTAQYNISLPIGCVFSPQVKNAFPISHQFALVEQEKEFAADFNESRPHKKLTAYEQDLFAKAVAFADGFFKSKNAPQSATGILDFLRGMIYEIAVISTSNEYLTELFAEEALEILKKRKPGKNTFTKAERNKEAESLAGTVRKSMFPYFMKTTLANMFKNLHPYEQAWLKANSKNQMQLLCQKAVNMANGGVGNPREHAAEYIYDHDSFMEVFDNFYEQTFNGAVVKKRDIPADPIAQLTRRFIGVQNLGSEEQPVSAVVVELRTPSQGAQQYKDMRQLCVTTNNTLRTVLDTFAVERKKNVAELDGLYEDFKKTGTISFVAKPKPINTPAPAPAIQPYTAHRAGLPLVPPKMPPLPPLLLVSPIPPAAVAQETNAARLTKLQIAQAYQSAQNSIKKVSSLVTSASKSIDDVQVAETLQCEVGIEVSNVLNWMNNVSESERGLYAKVEEQVRAKIEAQIKLYETEQRLKALEKQLSDKHALHDYAIRVNAGQENAAASAKKALVDADAGAAAAEARAKAVLAVAAPQPAKVSADVVAKPAAQPAAKIINEVAVKAKKSKRVAAVVLDEASAVLPAEAVAEPIGSDIPKIKPGITAKKRNKPKLEEERSAKRGKHEAKKSINVVDGAQSRSATSAAPVAQQAAAQPDASTKERKSARLSAKASVTAGLFSRQNREVQSVPAGPRHVKRSIANEVRMQK